MNTFLTISLWLMAVLFAWSGLKMIAGIGQPKKPTVTKPSSVAVVVAFQAFFCTVIEFEHGTPAFEEAEA